MIRQFPFYSHVRVHYSSFRRSFDPRLSRKIVPIRRVAFHETTAKLSDQLTRGENVIRSPRWLSLALACLLGPALLVGCQRAVLRQADASVYQLIEDRQQAAIGISSDANVGDETGQLGGAADMYRFNPHPVNPELPASFLKKTQNAPANSDDETHDLEAVAGAESSTLETGAEQHAGGEASLAPAADTEDGSSKIPAEKITSDIYTEDERANLQVFGLRESLAYAMRNARSLQDAKEDLYIAALDLTLERHLWTPQFVATANLDYTNSGEATSFDQAMTTVSEISASQRLPYGGEVTARLIDTFMRDLTENVTTGESGNFILEADIPLLRGAGRVAYESRYIAERRLVYAVRTYERFRRSFLVEAAARYFDLQQQKTAINNTYTSYLRRFQDWEKADFINLMGRSDTVFDAPRAKSLFRSAEAALVSAKEQYETTLDRFKIFVGMSVEELLDVVDQEADEDSKTLDGLLTDASTGTSVDVAIRYRLDLRNDADGVDDAKRGVVIAKNSILPDLSASGSVSLDSDPVRFNASTFNEARSTWQAGLQFQMDDRKTERNSYRRSLITLRRSQRDYEQQVDTVRAEVRAAIRRIAQQSDLRMIQALNVEENELRWQAARAQFDLGKTSNQDVVDAERELLTARNDFAGAVAQYRNAILEFRLATGTLRVADDGRWDASIEP